MPAFEFQNPFRPGAGHVPPYLAGRKEETKEFERLLKQPVLLENLVLTGLRGVGKTVLLDTLKPIAQHRSHCPVTGPCRIDTDRGVHPALTVLGV